MIKNILLPVDLGEETFSEKVIDTAVAMSQSNGATLHALVVVPGYSMSIVSQYFPADFEKRSQADAMRKLQAFITDKVPSDVATQCIVVTGTVYEEILKSAKDTDCDLVVMASHRPGLEQYLLGPNAAKVVRHAVCSVYVVRD